MLQVSLDQTKCKLDNSSFYLFYWLAQTCGMYVTTSVEDANYGPYKTTVDCGVTEALVSD